MNEQLFGDMVASRWKIPIASGGFDVNDSMSEVARLRSVTLELQEALMLRPRDTRMRGLGCGRVLPIECPTPEI